LGVTEVLHFFWRHRVAAADEGKHHITQRVSLYGKSLGMRHAAECLLQALHLPGVLRSQRVLSSLKALLAQGFGQHLTHVGHHACHVLLQASARDIDSLQIMT
jgi:hypothetical protein